MKKHSHRSWVEVDYKAITINTRTMKALLSDATVMMTVVKSNAYGHGIVASAKAALAGGASWLAVDEITEALALRKEGIRAPILVLGYTLPELYAIAAAKKISLMISSLESLQDLSKMKLAKPLHIHLKFETGLHRQGIMPSHVQQVIRLISSQGFPATIEGVYTHFAIIEDPMARDYSVMQRDALKEIVKKLNAKGFAPIVHASSSAGILFSKDFHFDMARTGIATYGIWPSHEIHRWAKETTLVPALSWKTIVSEVKMVEKGSKVGYDLTHTLSRNSRLAIIPVGYWHGMPRSLSNKGHVLVGGKKAPIVGRVSMDITIIDVTDIPSVRIGSEVVIIGAQGKEVLSAEEMAEMAGTINYELVTRINPLLPRLAV
ncbi:MAG TPA: alanine racemase [Candidatus Paceibacterota bacterium]